jgi:putative transcriptional regulator
MSGSKIIRGLEEALAYTKGELEGARIYKIAIERVDVRALRHHLGLTQAEFASDFGFSISAVRHWEQGKRHPERSAEVLLRLIAANPDFVRQHAKAIEHQHAAE